MIYTVDAISDTLCLQEICTARSAKNMADDVLEYVKPLGPSADDIAKLRIILAEVLNNIFEHAYQGIPGQVVKLTIASKNGYIRFQFADRGRAMPKNRLPQGTPRNVDCDIIDLPEGGFGWYLIHTLTDDIQYNRENGENRLSFKLALGNSLKQHLSAQT